MCQTLTINGITLDTVIEVKTAIPKIELIKKRNVGKINDYDCLCCIDFKKTLKKASIDFDNYGMYYFIEI